MKTHLEQQLSLDDTKKRFDNNIGRLSNLEIVQAAIIDAQFVIDLITQTAVKSTTNIRRVLDIGCGNGNNTIKLAEYISNFDCDLIDLSISMLGKARERISVVNTGRIRTFLGDFRDIEFPDKEFDVILAGNVLHHLHHDQNWEATFQKIYRLTAPGGSVWIIDLVSHETAPVQSIMWKQYDEYLCSMGGEDFKNKVFGYIDQQDSPRPVTYQLNLLREVGFDHVELLHKNSCFAAFGAIKSG